MDRQVVSSVWKYESKYDLYIAKFLELLLKYGYVWCEQDERAFRISLPDRERRLFAEDFREFQEGLTTFDMAFQMKKIRKLYVEELLELRKAGKIENESKLPWFSKAHSLFSKKTDEENEILRQENISILSDPPVTSNIALQNFQRKTKRSPRLPQTQVSSSSKTFTVSLTPVVASISATTPSFLLPSINQSLMSDTKPNTVGRPLETTTNFSSANSVKTTRCLTGKSNLRTISKTFTVSSPFKMTANSVKIRHPFSPPTSVSPVSRIPLRLTRSSPAGSPSQTTTEFSATRSRRSPFVLSSTEGMTASANKSSGFRIPFSSAVPSRAEVPLSPITAPWKTRVPQSTTTIHSRVKSPIFMNAKSFRRPPTSDQPGVAFSLAVSSSISGVPPSPIVSSSKARIPLFPNESSRPKVSASSIVVSSKTRISLLCNKPPPPYSPRIPPSSVATSFQTRVPSLRIPLTSNQGGFTSDPPTFSVDALTSSVPSSSQNILTTAPPTSCHGGLKSDAVTSKDGLHFLPYRSPPPYSAGIPSSSVAASSRVRVPSRQIALASRPITFTPNDSSASPGVFSSVPPSSSADFLTTYAPSRSESVLPTAFTPSSHGDIMLDSLSSKDGLPILHHMPEVPISTTVASSMAMSAASFSSAGLPLSPTTLYAGRTGVISPSTSSLRTKVPLSKTGASFSPIVETLPIGASSTTPEISPQKYPFSPRKAINF